MRCVLLIVPIALVASCSVSHDCDPATIPGQFVGEAASLQIAVELLADGTGSINQSGMEAPVTWEFDGVSEQVLISGSNSALLRLRQASGVPPAPASSPPTTRGIHAMSLRCDVHGRVRSLVADDNGVVQFGRKTE
jgi:hypothetical protein